MDRKANTYIWIDFDDTITLEKISMSWLDLKLLWNFLILLNERTNHDFFL